MSHSLSRCSSCASGRQLKPGQDCNFCHRSNQNDRIVHDQRTCLFCDDGRTIRANDSCFFCNRMNDTLAITASKPTGLNIRLILALSPPLGVLWMIRKRNQRKKAQIKEIPDAFFARATNASLVRACNR
jgi:hypothetical protein